MAEQEQKTRLVRAKDVLSRRFWLYLFTALVITLIFPLVRLEAEGENTAVPVYEAYQEVFLGSFERWALLTILLHVSICFAATFAGRYWILRAMRKSEEER